MKILYIHNADFDIPIANRHQVISMCKALYELGQDVSLICFGNKQKFQKNFGKQNFRVIFLKPEKNYYLRSIKLVFKSKKMLCDGIFTRDLFVANRLAGIKPTIYEVHEILNNKLWNILLNKTIPKLRSLVIISKGLQKVLPDAMLLPDAVDLKRFDIKTSRYTARKILGLPQNKKIVCYLGQISAQRDIDTILKVSKMMPEIEFYLYGINSEYSNTKNFHLQGYTNTPELVYKASNIQIASFTNRVRTINYMSPLKIFEIASSKTPLVLSDFPRNREVFDDTEVFYYNSENTDSLRKAIINALNDKSKVQRAFLKVKNHTWKNRAQQIIDQFSNH